jgi:hypothetical protein
VRIVNNSSNKASFYSFNTKALQGSSQFEAEYSSDYPKVQSELLAGVESSGVIVFPAMDPTKTTKFVLEASTDDYSLDFEPYTFEVEP